MQARGNGTATRNICEIYCMLCRRSAAATFLLDCRRTNLGSLARSADAFNDIVSANERMAQQLEQVGQTVGREGRTRKRLRLGVSAGAWGEMEGSVNALD